MLQGQRGAFAGGIPEAAVSRCSTPTWGKIEGRPGYPQRRQELRGTVLELHTRSCSSSTVFPLSSVEIESSPWIRGEAIHHALRARTGLHRVDKSGSDPQPPHGTCCWTPSPTICCRTAARPYPRRGGRRFWKALTSISRDQLWMPTQGFAQTPYVRSWNTRWRVSSRCWHCCSSSFWELTGWGTRSSRWDAACSTPSSRRLRIRSWVSWWGSWPPA